MHRVLFYSVFGIEPTRKFIGYWIYDEYGVTNSTKCIGK